MAEIILRRRVRNQPQIAVPLDRGHKLFPYIAFAWSAGRGLQDGRHPNPLGSYVGTIQHTVGLHGRSVIPADASSYVQFGDLADYNQLGNITVIARIRSGGTTVQQGIITKSETSGGTNTPFALFTEAGGALSLNRSNSGFRVWSSAATISAGADYVVAVTQTADISLAPSFFLNGVKDTGAPTSLYGGSGTGAPTGNTTSLKIGNRTDLASQSFHNVHDAFLFTEILSDSTIRALAYELDYLWEAPRRRLCVVPASGASGTVSYTNANDTLAASGTTTVTGTLAKTNANDTSTASGTTTVTGLLSKTNANDTSSASGTTTVTGSLARTNADDAVSASGSVGSAVTGSLAYTNADDTSSASGTTTVTGSLTTTSPNDSSSASGTTTILGTLARTNANDTVSASGTVSSGSTGTVAYTNQNDTLSASGTTTILGSLARTNANDSIAASGIVNSGIIVESALTDGVTSTIRIKKPGVPNGTPDWLKTILEIVLGRRGNKITAPAEQTLTFSATPTKAECEALYSYVNTVRDSVDQLLNRLDS